MSGEREIPVLDRGYVRVVESWGSDQSIVEAARMSTGKGFQGWGGYDTPGDEKLLSYLWKNEHATPFEMAGMVVEVKAPIMVFREWHRHRTQSYNEMSARYVPLPDEDYLPTPLRLVDGARKAGPNKQAGVVPGAAELDDDVARTWLRDLEKHYASAQELYARGLAEGVPKELARLALTVGRYSRMRASANLRNWLAFLKLRMAPNAQWEIRECARAVAMLLADAFPRTFDLFAATNGISL